MSSSIESGHEDGVRLEASLTIPEKQRRRALVLPREHGAWGMLLIPLSTGAAVGVLSGGRFTPVTFLTVAVLSLFWLRTPVESWLGTGAVRAQTPEERRYVSKFALPLAVAAATSLTALFWQGANRNLILLALLASPAFAAQMFLQKRGRSTRMAAEVVGALALTSAAPAAYCVATGRMDTRACVLWAANWVFAGDQIHFVWLRIRGMRAAGWREKLALGWSFVVGQILLIGVLVLAHHLKWLPALAAIAFVPILFRGCVWFAAKPGPIVIRRLGQSELLHAVAFGVLLIVGFARLR
jgi:hypothetical protein